MTWRASRAGCHGYGSFRSTSWIRCGFCDVRLDRPLRRYATRRRRGRVPLPPVEQFVCSERGTVQITLAVLATEPADVLRLFGCFDALDADAEFEGVRQRDHRVHQRV